MAPSANADRVPEFERNPTDRSEAASPMGRIPASGPGAEAEPAVSIVLFCSRRVAEAHDILEQLIDLVVSKGGEYELIVALDGHLGALHRAFRDRLRDVEYARLVKLNTDQGQVATIRAGLSVSRGRRVITFPGFPQISLDAIPLVLEGLEEGNDYVVGYRKSRRDSFANRMLSSLFNRLIRYTTGVEFRDIACGIHGMRREVAESIPNYGGNQIFVPILLSREGFRIGEVAVPPSEASHRFRVFSPAMLFRRGLDLLTLAYLMRFTQKPLRPFGALGVILLALGTVLSLILAWQRLFLDMPLAERPMLLLALLLVTAGIQVIILGFLGELLLYLHFRGQIHYRVEERFGGDGDEEVDEAGDTRPNPNQNPNKARKP